MKVFSFFTDLGNIVKKKTPTSHEIGRNNSYTVTRNVIAVV